MSELKVFAADAPPSAGGKPELQSSDPAEIARVLADKGVRFERWEVSPEIVPGAPSEAVLAAYAEEIEFLKTEGGYRKVDVVSMGPDHPERVALRAKFRIEHTHTEDEVRFFVAGEGLFAMHLDQKVYEIHCVQGDLISLPANARHWFDMGPEPHFVALRFFLDPSGWVANPTGSKLGALFSSLGPQA